MSVEIGKGRVTVLPEPERSAGRNGGRPYIGPRAQTSVHEAFFNRVVAESLNRDIPMADVWREVIYAGLVRTGRATPAEAREACSIVGLDPKTLNGTA